MDRFSMPVLCLSLLGATLLLSGCPGVGVPPEGVNVDYTVLGYNDLGMHCMNEDFSEFMILPPYNTLHAQVIRRGGEEPDIVRSGVTVEYSIINHTTSVDKTNFWDYAYDLFGVNLAPDVGLTGNTLAGTMSPTGNNDWNVTGIPVTPISDSGALEPYPIAQISVYKDSAEVARTYATVPVSWEISCNLCHDTPGISVATDILRKHDQLHGTTLELQKPVACGSCHGQAPLGTDGSPTLSAAMHGSHSDRMDALALDNTCYACHPGFETNCQRDIHFSKGVYCVDCHGGMEDVADPGRRPWLDEPRCGSCHQRHEFEFEPAGVLFREAKGHGGVHCAACHGSPHAITPTVTWQDNYQANYVQGYPGVINNCTVCHTTMPDEGFEHERDD